MRKICGVLTARTSYTKIKPILKALALDARGDLQIVCAASAVLERYGNVDEAVESDGFRISERIFMLLEDTHLSNTVKSTGMGLIEFAGVFERLKPDIVLVMADRYEVIAPAIAASYQNIPLAHVQGGEVSGNIDDKVRNAITKLADYHFPATEKARETIINMGSSPDKVFLTGCPAMDLAKEVIENPLLEFDVYGKYGGVGPEPNLTQRFIVVMQHPVTNEYSDATHQAVETLEAVSEFGCSVLWFWPNSDAGSDETSKAIRTFRELRNPANIHFFKNMEPEDFLRLLYASDGIVGNSSVAVRECSFLGVPAVDIGSRQQNRERGPNIVHATYDRSAIRDAICNHLNGHVKRSSLYGQGLAGQKIASILASI